MRAELDAGIVALETTYAENEAVKQVPGARWNRSQQRWELPLAWGPLVALQGIFGGRVEAGPLLREWTATYHRDRVVPAYDLRGLTDTEGDPDLWPLQRVGVRFLNLANHAILADDMGTGKTRQVSYALNEYDYAEDRYPALVVCPASVRPHWRRELEQAGHRVAVADGNVGQRRSAIASVKEGEADVLVINWANLWAHSRCAPYGGLKMKRCEECGAKPDEAVSVRSCETHDKELNEVSWQAVIADEAHRAANPKAKVTRALWWLGRDADIRWALTGTPVKDRLDSAYGLLHFAFPEDFPSYVKLRDRYCLTAYNPWSGGQDTVGLRPDTQQELFSILDHRFLRRTKAEAMPWLPPKVYVRREVELKPKHRKMYDAMKNDLMAQVEGGQLIAWNPLEQGLRLAQIAAATPEVEEYVDDEGLTRQRVTALKDPSPKLDELELILEEMGERPVVVFAPSLKLIRLAKARLEKLGISFASIDGDTSHLDREEGETAFQEGRIRVMLLTAAGAEGVTLTRADTMVFLQRPWSLIQSQQAEDRVHRGGAEAHSAVTIIDVIAKDTDDERVLDVLLDKEEGAEEVLRDRERMLALLKG